jgi:hypothetical protein
MAVRDTDKGWKAMRKRAAKMAKGSTVQVGILGEDAAKVHQPEDGEKASGATIGEIGEFHEFGLGNNPVRSWLRGYVDANNAQIQAKVNRLAEEVISGRMTPEQALDTLGMSLKGGIQKRIAEGIMPQVTAATQKRKGPSKTIPLINSGQFRGSINYKVVPGAIK